MISAIQSTFHCYPPGSPFIGGPWSEMALEAALRLFSGAFGWAVLMAAPVFVAGLIAEVMISIVARSFPYMGRVLHGQSLRAILVQLAMLAILGAVLVAGMDFLQSGINALSGCLEG